MFIFVIFSIFNIIYSSPPIVPYILRPMSEREIDFGDDVCHYTHIHEMSSSGTTQIIEYVKGCKKGKVCKETTANNLLKYEIKTCQEYDELELLTLGEKCEYDSQCDGNLICKDDTCTIEEGNEAYYKEGYYYCPSNYIPVYDSISEKYRCQKQSDYTNYSKDRCYYDDENNNRDTFAPEFLKVCGEIKFYKIDRTSPQYINNIKEILTASIGSQPDGTYVSDPAACQSGFTLLYYPEKQIVRKTNDNDRTMTRYSRCATIDEVDIDNGIIKYSLDGKEYKMLYSQISDGTNIKHIKIKLDMFKKFKDKMGKCEGEKYKKNPFTCDNRKLQEYYYFYYHPDHYILYKDEDQIIDYLLYSQYNSFSFIILLFFLFLI